MGRGNSPTYEQLMLQTDGAGQNRGLSRDRGSVVLSQGLSSHANLLVPVVGNFGGPKAIRAVGRYVKNAATA